MSCQPVNIPFFLKTSRTLLFPVNELFTLNFKWNRRNLSYNYNIAI